MAARVGTGVYGEGASTASTIASAAKSTTTGNLLVAVIKWEGNPTLSSVSDTAGNTWTIIRQRVHGSGNPDVALAYAENITGNASNVVTATFSSAFAEWRRILVEEFSGIATSSSLDGSYQDSTGTTADYTTADITTTTSGLVVLGVGDYASLSSLTGTPGNPDFSVGVSYSDTAFFYYISGSAQTITPGGGATGKTQWVAIAQAFKDAAGGGGTPVAVFSYHYIQQGIQ